MASQSDKAFRYLSHLTRMNYKIEFGYKWLPERRELKSEGKYIIPPAFKYTVWDFIKDILSGN